MDLLITYSLRKDSRSALVIDTKIIREVHMRDAEELQEILEGIAEELAERIFEEIESQ